MVVEFLKAGDRVTVRETFDAEETHSVEQQRTGWQAILDRFARHVEGVGRLNRSEDSHYGEVTWRSQRRTRSACGTTATPRRRRGFYAATFPDSSVGAIHHAPGDFPDGKKGDLLVVEFTVLGIPCIGLNGGPDVQAQRGVLVPGGDRRPGRDRPVLERDRR